MLVSIVILIIVLSVSLFLFVPRDQKKEKELLSFDAEKNILQITDKLPISDYSASTLDIKDIDSTVLDSISFSVSSLSNETIDYEIYLSDDSNNSYIDSNYVKILLTDSAGNNYNVSNGIVPKFSELSGSVRFPGYRRVYYGRIDPGHIKRYIIKMWVSDEYLIKPEGKKFVTKLFVKTI